MKDKITGYITGVINNHIRIVASMKKHGYQEQLIQLHENCINEFNDLLDYVMDIPEEKATDTYIEINRLRDILAKKDIRSDDLALEIIMLRQGVAELEESAIAFREQFLDDKEKIKNLEKENHESWERNKRLNIMYKKARDKARRKKNE